MSDRDSIAARREALERLAPCAPRGLWRRDGDRVYLCGTLGAAFDAFQRQRAAVSATDAYLLQQIGLVAIEREMDRLEAEARQSLADGETLLPRRSPGYPGYPIEMSREIVRRLDATRRLGVGVTAANLLVPSKSVTAMCEVKT